MERNRFEPSEGFENKDRETLWWRTSHRSDTHLHILRVYGPPNGSILSAVLRLTCVIRAVIPLCVHVSDLDGVFMLFTPRIRNHRYGSTHTRVVYRTHVLPHTCAPAPCGRERSIYTLRQLVNLASSFRVFCLPKYILLLINPIV
jgi:hypothetical protein